MFQGVTIFFSQKDLLYTRLHITLSSLEEYVCLQVIAILLTTMRLFLVLN